MPTLTEHIYVSILDRKIFYEAIRWLISERDVSTIATQTGETSFHLHSLIESLSNLYKCTDYELKTHLNFFLKTNQTATFVIVWDFIVFKLLSDTLPEIAYVYLFTLTGFSHPHSPPGLDSQLLVPRSCPSWSCGAVGFHPCGQSSTGLETLSLPEIFRLGQTFRLCSFKRT